MQEGQAAPEGGSPDSPARNAAFTLALNIVGAVFTGALTVLLVRKLGPSEYGVFALALSIAVIVVMVADFGIAHSAAKSVAEHRRQPDELNAVLGTSVRLKILVSALVSAGLAALAGPIAHAYGIPELAWPLRVMAIAVFGQSLTLLWFRTFEAAGRVLLGLKLAFGESAVETSTSITLVLLGAGAVGAATGRAIGYAFAVLFGVLLATRSLGWRMFGTGRQQAHLRRIARYALAILLIDGAMTLFSSIDVLLISGFLGSEAAGVFQAPMQLTFVANFAGLALAAGVGPGLAHTLRDEAAVDRLLQAIRLLVVVQAMLVPPFVIWARPIVDLVLGPGYGDSVGVLRGLAPYLFLMGIVTLVTIAVNYMGEAWRRVPIAISTLLINLILDVILIPRIGVIAGAIGTSVALAFYASAHLWVLTRALRIKLAPLFLTGARCLAAAAAMAGVLAVAGTHSLTITGWLVGGACGVLVYAAVLIATRELTVGELQALRSRAAASFSAGASS